MWSLEKEKNLELSEDKFSSPLCPVEHPTLLVLAGELHLALLVQHQGEGVLLQVLDVCLKSRWALSAEQSCGTRNRFFTFHHSDQPRLL